MKCIPLVLCALAFMLGEAQAQVTPLWSVPVGETRADPRLLHVVEPVVLPDGGGYFLGAFSGARPSLFLAPDGRRVRGQSISGSNNEVLAATADRVLVGQDNSAELKAIQLRDLHGTVLWTAMYEGTAARFLADGDVIVLADHQLLRLRASDGTPRWSRHLRDLHPDTEDAYFKFAAVDAQIDLVGSLVVSTRQSFNTRTERWQFAIDSADGAIRWAQRFEPDHPSNQTEICPPGADGDLVVSAWRVSGSAGHAFEVQLRTRSSGELIWSVPLDSSPPWSCDLVMRGSRIYLALSFEEHADVLALQVGDGAQIWSSVQQQVSEARLQVGSSGDLLLRAHEGLVQGAVRTRFARHRAEDGEVAWSFSIQSVFVAWRVVADKLHLALVLPGPDLQNHHRVRVESRGVADGALLASEEDVVTGRRTLAYATGFVGDAACYAQSALDNTVVVRCLDGLGEERWSRVLPAPPPGDEVSSLWISPMAPGRFGVRATHRRTVDGTQIEDYRITALDSATGAIAWQREAYQEAPYWLGSEDGGAYVVHATCTSQPGCVGRQAKLDRVSGVDGSVLWSRAVTRQPLVEQGGRLFTMLASIPVPVVSGHDVVTGSDAWVTPLPPAFTSQVEGAMSADGSLVVKNTTAIGATTRRIEVRGFDPVSGIQRWLLMPTIPNQRTSGGMLVPMTGKTFLATGSLTPTTPGGIGSWLAAIDANSGQFRWEQEMAIGRDSSRTVFFAAPGSERVWLGQRRTSNSGLERHALGTLDPQAGQLGREHQFFSESPDWINGATIPPAPRTLLADGSLLAEARRSRVDGFQLPLMQRWPAPAGASGDIVLELATPSPVLGHGREAFVELRVENRSDIAVADVRVGFAPSGSGQAGRVVDCSAQTGMVQCSVDGEYSRPRLDLGPGAVARVRYAVTSGIYWPARSTDSGSVYFHIDPPYDIGDDLGDNTVEARIWLGGTSNGFE